MPSSNLAAYLAKNYLTASNAISDPNEPPKKKRKKSKHQPATSGLVIADDDEDLSLSNAHSRNGTNAEDEDIPMMYEGKVRSAEFRKAKKSAWQSLPGADTERPSTTTGLEGDDNDADTLLRTAQSDEARRLAEREAEDAPAIVSMDIDTDTNVPKIESGIRAGLQTAADTARMIAEEEAATAAQASLTHKSSSKKSKKNKSKDEDDGNDEATHDTTIYRDASGRRIDISARRAAAKAEEKEKARLAAQEKRDAMGDVQVRERAVRKAELEDAKFLTVARGVEDEEMNEQLKSVVRWDDPMAAYMASKSAAEVGGGKGGSSKTKGEGRGAKKVYQGSAAPNRYGIVPGWRWDGVDRGNGFEKDWFQARSRRARNEKLSYEWQMDE